MASIEELVGDLERIEEDLRDRAYDRLAEAAANGDPQAIADEKKLSQARRGIEKAIRALRELGELAKD